MEINEKYMKRALALARGGELLASPNPMVGAVITDPAGNIIGEGYHRCCGEAHAEVNAIASVADPTMLAYSTMYVTLEPCAHYGRTGPCSKLIIDKRIPRVVVGTTDPFSKVNGKGIEMMREAGVEVVTGILERECRSLNARFFTAHTLKRPFITLKWAQSADGFMDDDSATPARLSTPLTAALTHRLRAISDAIAVGSGTVLSDDPSLTTRLWPGRSPRPVVFDSRRRISPEATVMQSSPIIISGMPLTEAMQTLYEQNITSLLVEGGPTLLKSFLEAGLWDLIRVETAPAYLGSHGTAPAPIISGIQPLKEEKIDGNCIKYYSQNALVDVKNL